MFLHARALLTQVLITAITALNKSDTTRALKVLEERLMQLARRSKLRPDSSDEESDSSDESDDEGATAPDSGRSDAEGKEPGACESGDVLLGFQAPPDEAVEWERLAEGQLSARCQLDGVQGEWGLGEHMQELQRDIVERGYFIGPEAPADAKQLAGTVMKGMEALRRSGVPTFYIWMFDEPWRVMLRLWRHAERILEGPVVLEPTFAAYHLNYTAAAEHGNRYNGTNFALPHRDYTFSDSFDSEGRPKVLTVWVPMSEVRSDNGCMYVVPREFDVYHDRDDVQEHMLVQHTGWLQGKSFLGFPLAAIRALAPASPATAMGWLGNTIHWGSQCHHASADCPRASIAWVFKRADAVHNLDVTPVDCAGVQALSLTRRRALIESSMEFFKHWSTVEKGPWHGEGTGGMGARVPGRA